MKALRNISLVLAMLFVFAAPTAEAEVVSNLKLVYSDSVLVPCANSGRGERVRLSGTMHALFRVTHDENGGRHVASQFQPMGVTGYGEVTGDKYQAAGITRHEWNFQPADYPVVYTEVNNYWIIGPGPGNNFLVHETYHITLNANGDVTAEVLGFKGECK